MGQSSDELRQEIDQHRANASDKIDALSNQLTGTADELKGQAQQTVDDLKDTVQTTVDDTVESVKQTVQDFDIERHVQERPLVSVGAAMLGGVILGILLDSGDDDRSRDYRRYDRHDSDTDTSSGAGAGMSLGLAGTLRKAMRDSGLEDQISNAGAALMGSVTDQIKQVIDQNLPGFADKMDTANRTEGGVTDKTREVYEPRS